MKEKTIKELIKELNDLKIVQSGVGYEGDIPNMVYDKYNGKNIMEALEPVKHRWEEYSTLVIKVLDSFMGVVYISDLDGMGMVSDYNHKLEFFEMEEIQTVTYKPKT